MKPSAAEKLARELTTPEFGLVTRSQAETLLRLAREYTRIQERWCNEDMSSRPGLEDKVKAREAKLKQDIRALATQLPITKGVKFTGDPRGFCVRILRKDDRYNTWGGVEDGWGIA